MSTIRSPRHMFLGVLAIILSIATLLFVFYFFQKDQKSAALRVFYSGSMVPVLVSVLGAEEVEQRVILEYGVEHNQRGRLFSERVEKVLQGAEVLTQEIQLPETMGPGEYAAFVNIVDEHGAVLEAGRLRFEVRGAGFYPPQLKIFLLYLLFCVAFCCTWYIVHLLFKKHNRESVGE